MRCSKPCQHVRFARIGAVLLLGILANLTVWAAPETIGHLTEARGLVELNGAAATTGAELRLGMRVVTGTDGRAVLTFADGQTVLLGPDSVFWIKDYRHTKNQPRENRSTTELLKGGMRFISGTMAKETPEVVKIGTPVATIGIRGTDFTAVLGSLCLLVRDGAVIVTAASQSLVARAGQIVFVQNAATPPRLVPAPELRAPCAIPQDTGVAVPPTTVTVSCACRDLLKMSAADVLIPSSTAATSTATTAAIAAGATIGVGIGAAILLQDNEDPEASPP